MCSLTVFALCSEAELPVKPQKEWVHMDKLEPEKLEWMKDLPPPRKKGTEKVRLTLLIPVEKFCCCSSTIKYLKKYRQEKLIYTHIPANKIKYPVNVTESLKNT